LAQQAGIAESLGSPFMGQLLGLLARAGLPAGGVADRIRDWPGDISASGDAVALRLAGALPGQLHLVYHTVAWQYVLLATRSAVEDSLAEAGARATADAPLARFGMEVDDRDESGAGLRLHLWPGEVILDLGRADFHGCWVRWAAPEPVE
jgi:hypothetical protein